MIVNNTKYFEAKNNLTGIQVFPLEEADTSVSASNIYKVDGKLYLDLNITNINEFFDTVKIMSLSENDLISLQKSGFPSTLSKSARKKLFSLDKNEIIFKAEELIRSIRVDLKETPGQNFKILISLTGNGIETGQVFLFSVNRQDIIDKTENTSVSQKDLQVFKQSDSTTISDFIKENSYTSDILYSFSNQNNLDGFYVLDAQKFINERTKFPNLIQIEDEQQFTQFLISTKVQISTYDSANFGYEFEDILAIVDSQSVEQLKVQNTDQYKFYNFFTPTLNPFANYELKIILYFNDITIGIAEELLTQMLGAAQEKNRQEVVNIISQFFGEQIPSEYKSLFDNYQIISDADFEFLVGGITSLISEKLDSATERVVVNQHISSQYTKPSFYSSNYFPNYFEQNFEKKIKIKSDKNNKFFNLTNQTFFKSILSADVEDGDKKYVSALAQSFKKINNLKAIPVFSVVSTKEDEINQGGLTNKVNCGDSDQKRDEKIGFQIPQSILELVTTKEQDVEVSYLDNIGETVSALNFKKLTQEVLDLIEPGQRILARLDNYEEFYDSYFYIVGSGI